MDRALDDRIVLDLVEHIYAAGCDPRTWPNFVDRVHTALPGVGFSALLGIEGTRIDTNSANAGIDPAFISSYIAHFQFINPYNAIFPRLEVGKVYTTSDLTSTDWLERQVFYHEWLKPAGNLTHGATVIVARDERRLMRVGFDIPRCLSQLEVTCAELLRRLGPHVARAFEVNERLHASVVAEQALVGMIERIQGAALLIARTGRVVALNAEAERTARTGAIFGIGRDRRLSFRNSVHDDGYKRALAGELEPQVGQPNAFTIQRADLPPLTVMVLPLRPATGSAAMMTSQPMALVLLRTFDSPRMPRDVLRALYGLTGAEAELASRIAGGWSVTDAAEQLGVSRTTARNQLAAAMGKMGVHRQGELVARVGALAPKLKFDHD